MDVSESPITSPRIPKPENPTGYQPPLDFWKQAPPSPKKEVKTSPKKEVKFSPVSYELKYDPNAELQKPSKADKKAEEYLRIAKAALEKVREEQEVDVSPKGAAGYTTGERIGRGSPSVVVPGRPAGAECPSSRTGGVDPVPRGTKTDRSSSRHPSASPTKSEAKQHDVGGSPKIPVVVTTPRDDGAGASVPYADTGTGPKDPNNPVFGSTSWGGTVCYVPGTTGPTGGFGTAHTTTNPTNLFGQTVGNQPTTGAGWTFGDVARGAGPTFANVGVQPTSQSGVLPSATFAGVGTPLFAQPGHEVRHPGARSGTHSATTSPTKAKGTQEERERASRRDGTPGRSRSQSEAPVTRSQRGRLDKLGLLLWPANEEGKNESYVVKMLAERWIEDKQRLRQRVIDGDEPGDTTLAEHKRRYKFILREAARTGCPLPTKFKIT